MGEPDGLADSSADSGQTHGQWRQAFLSHPRNWRGNLYVYPVLSRRARGISIGINLNPARNCNFSCVYCQVQRTCTPRTKVVDMAILRFEYHGMLELVRTGQIFLEKPFADAPPQMRRIADVAFSGDGEPTLSRVFDRAVDLVIDSKLQGKLDWSVKVTVLTNTTGLTRQRVQAALDRLHDFGGEIWAKLDAGSEDCFRKVNRARISFARILRNISMAAKRWRVVIQSMWFRMHGVPPAREEIEAFAGRLSQIVSLGGTIGLVQVYTIARPPAEPFVEPLCDEELEAIAELVRQQTGLPVETYPPEG